MLRTRQFLALVSLTTVEAVRQPICLLLATSCVVLTAVTSLVLMHTFGDGGELVRDSGLACHLVFGLFIAGYGACSSLSREMRSGTAAVVLSKPVSRELFFLSKFAGVASVVIMFSACAMLTTLMGERVAEKFYDQEGFHGWIQDTRTGLTVLAAPILAFLLAGLLNYRKKRPFVSTAFALLFLCLLGVFLVSGFYAVDGNVADFGFRVQWQVVPAGVLITLALLVVSALALALSTRLKTVPTLSVCTVLLIVGLMADYMFGRHVQGSWLARFAYAATPNWQHFWVADSLRDGGTVPLRYIASALGYAGLYAAGLLFLGMLSFSHAEVD